MDEAVLRRRVREAVQAGRLPGRFPDELLGGPASGGDCAVCGRSTGGGMELELVYTDTNAHRKSYFAHPQCLPIFQREIQALTRPVPKVIDGAHSPTVTAPVNGQHAPGGHPPTG